MQVVNKQIVYNVKGYEFVNYTQIDYDTKLLILEWRNDPNIRQWMYNTETISLNTHFEFIEKLDKRNDCCYWVVFEDSIPIGTVNLTCIDLVRGTAELGYFMRPDYNQSGDGLKFVYNAFLFAFDVVGVDALYGAVNTNNKSAYQLDLFLGCRFFGKKNIETKSGSVEFNECYITRDDFFCDIDKKDNILYFIKYLKGIKNESK